MRTTPPVAHADNETGGGHVVIVNRNKLALPLRRLPWRELTIADASTSGLNLRGELQALLLGEQVFAKQHLGVLTGRRRLERCGSRRELFDGATHQLPAGGRLRHDGPPPKADAALPRVELREELLGNSVRVVFDIHERQAP